MNHVKTLASLAFAGLLVTGCSSHETKVAGPEDYKNAVANAKLSLDKAKKMHFEWRDSGKILKKAAQAAKSGDYASATKLANKAKRQGELAVAQANAQKNAGPHL